MITDDYAVINDEAHASLFLLYHVDIHRQLLQLVEAGFQSLDMVDLNGKPIAPDSNDPHLSAIDYMSQKNG